MKKSLIRLAASVVLSVALVAVISASGILTNGHRSDGLFYQASGIRPDAELLTVNGETIDAEEYLYWVAYDCEYLSANVSDLDFDAELSDGMTYGAYAKQDALETVKLYAVIRQWARQGNVTLTDSDREALEKQRQQYINYYGSQEAYLKQIQGMGVSETMFDSINQGYYLYAGVRQAFCTEGSALYPAQEDIDALAKDSGYATCLLLYWPLDGEDDDPPGGGELRPTAAGFPGRCRHLSGPGGPAGHGERDGGGSHRLRRGHGRDPGRRRGGPGAGPGQRRHRDR